MRSESSRGLTPSGLVNLATLFGMVYLTIAVMCVLHLASRIGALRGSRIDHDMLDAALILVVVSTLIAATPAILQGATEYPDPAAAAALAGGPCRDAVDDRAPAGNR